MAADALSSLEFLHIPPTPESALQALAEPVRHWFAGRFAEPTAAQRLAWPAIAAGKHLLLCAPTGYGKTLAAFLPIFGELLAGPRTLRCLYVAPLKALIGDIRKNLREAAVGVGQPRIRVGIRTGDTSQRRRRLLSQRPPHVLLTTPESLAVLLCGPTHLFGELRWVIVDELHALAGNKRGADLSLSLERLQGLTRHPLQRVGLSASCAPLAEAAQFLAGTGRPCAIAQVSADAPLRLHIEPLPDAGKTFFTRLVNRLEEEIAGHETTLIFSNTRSLAERLTWTCKQRWPQWVDALAAHHSSLAAGRRREVERLLKLGRLRAVFCSTSLELGIDVGSVENVVLIHPPGAVVRLLQRVGRAGHAPGKPRRGLVLTDSPSEIFEAAVTAASITAGSAAVPYERLDVATQPLDVLCQQLLGMASLQEWTADEAFALVRRAYPYHSLARDDFDACLAYLSGRGRDGGAWLPARLDWDGDRFTLRDERTLRLLRRNVGTILSEEPCMVRRLDPEQPDEYGPAIGELDEAFADRLNPGDRFLLDGRCLQVSRSGFKTLLVEEVPGRPRVPRWQGGGWRLSAELAFRLYAARYQMGEALRDGRLAGELRTEYGLGDEAGRQLVEHFQRQEGVSEIPGPGRLLVECVPSAFDVDYFLHTPLHQLANDALARVVCARLSRERGLTAYSLAADLGCMLTLTAPAELTPDDWRRLLSEENLDADLAAAVAEAGLVRERFRQVALTGLMLLRNPLGGRHKVGGRDWAERRLFEQVTAIDPEFVLLRQALREVRREVCDASEALAYARKLPGLEVRCRWLTCCSPFAEGWSRMESVVSEPRASPEEALRRLHSSLTGQNGAAAGGSS
jgi:ATP-dependent Lhr-like helicase